MSPKKARKEAKGGGLGKGCVGRFGTDYGCFHYFLWEKYS
jgi:hypothetical protein